MQTYQASSCSSQQLQMCTHTGEGTGLLVCRSARPPVPFAGEGGRDGIRKTLLGGKANAAGVLRAWRSAQKVGGV